ncbi:WD40/YVTN/BNR-like repeat-containing protein [Longispora albida]|uniref:WD40/YVTN/BNR-like repeat-containing protein n=1 Tax=Longispora albida TaxID=203523 RepID=UPI0003AA1BCB|nr:sialidase family protein [Longispora albida]
MNGDTIEGISAPPRRTRRWLVPAIGVGAALVLTAGMVTWLTLSDSKGREPAKTAKVSKQVSTPLPAGTAQRGTGSRLIAGDSTHLYSPGATCKPEGPQDTCEITLGVSSDQGATWTWFPIPGTYSGGPKDFVPDSTHLTITARGTRVAMAYSGLGKSWATDDAGRTWTIRETAPEQFPAVARIPDGATLEHAGGIVLSVDGQLSKLQNPPPQVTGTSDGIFSRSADGTFWYGGSYDNGAVALYTRDQGRSWQYLTGPDGARKPQISVRDGRHIYVSAFKDRRVWRTADDGKTWQELALPPGKDWISPLATADGGLAVITTSGEALTVTKDGTALTTAASGLPVNFARAWGDEPMSGAGKTGARYRSADGVQWTPFTG